MIGLTEKQGEVLAWLTAHPGGSVRELAAHLGCATNAAYGHIKRLVAKGLVVTGDGKSRAILVVGQPTVAQMTRGWRILEEMVEELNDGDLLDPNKAPHDVMIQAIHAAQDLLDEVAGVETEGPTDQDLQDRLTDQQLLERKESNRGQE